MCTNHSTSEMPNVTNLHMSNQEELMFTRIVVGRQSNPDLQSAAALQLQIQHWLLASHCSLQPSRQTLHHDCSTDINDTKPLVSPSSYAQCKLLLLFLKQK